MMKYDRGDKKTCRRQCNKQSISIRDVQKGKKSDDYPTTSLPTKITREGDFIC